MQKINFRWCTVGAVTLSAWLFNAAPVLNAKPKAPRAQLTKVANPLRGVPLPIPEYHDIERETRNERWEDIARLLRVRDLRVQSWQRASRRAGIVDWQKKITLQRLKAAGYAVQEWKWDNWQKTTGFEAWRQGEKLSALWSNNGSGFYLYWGHQAPQTPAQKRDDDLIAAAIDGEVEKVRAQLKQGANPFAVDYGGASVLIQATREGHAGIVGQILEAREARPNAAPSTDFDAAMQLAVFRNEVDSLRAFLKAGATPAQIGAALQGAASRGATEAAQVLLPNAPQAFVDAALVTASFVEHWRGSAIQYPEIVKLLLTRKPSQSALDAAMIHAAQDDEADVVQILLKAGADVKAINEQGETALIRAAADLRDVRNVRALLDAGAEPNARDKKGVTPLINATSNYSDIIALLLARGADPKAQNLKGETARSLLQKRIVEMERYTSKTMQLEKAQLGEIVELLKNTGTK